MVPASAASALPTAVPVIVIKSKALLRFWKILEMKKNTAVPGRYGSGRCWMRVARLH